MTQFMKVRMTREAVRDTNGLAVRREVERLADRIPIKPPLYVVQAFVPPPPNLYEMIEMRVFYDFTPDHDWQKAIRLALTSAEEATR